MISRLSLLPSLPPTHSCWHTHCATHTHVHTRTHTHTHAHTHVHTGGTFLFQFLLDCWGRKSSRLSSVLRKKSFTTSWSSGTETFYRTCCSQGSQPGVEPLTEMFLKFCAFLNYCVVVWMSSFLVSSQLWSFFSPFVKVWKIHQSPTLANQQPQVRSFSLKWHLLKNCHIDRPLSGIKQGCNGTRTQLYNFLNGAPHHRA